SSVTNDPSISETSTLPLARGGVAVRIPDERRRPVPTPTGGADLGRAATRRVDEQDAAIPGIGHGHAAVLQEIGVVGLGEVTGSRARHTGVAVAPLDRARREGEAHDRVVALLVGDDAVATGGEEGVV